MKILIDGYWWHEGPYSNRMVLLEILAHWGQAFPADELVVAAPKTNGHAHESMNPNIDIVNTHLRIHPAINFIELPIIARREHADAILAFNFAAMSRRGVVFLHDVLFQTNPEWFTRIERAYDCAMPLLARYAPTVLASSQTERNRISENNPKLQRVVACGLAVSSSLAASEERPPSNKLSRDSYILCVGRFNVRKNLEFTIRAMLKVGCLSPEFPLVVVGEPSGLRADLSEFTSAFRDGSVINLGHVGESEMKWLYLNCKFFICLSLDEGFGLPVVEAAKFGAPVLASDVPVFHETLGSHASFAAPKDERAVIAAAQRMVSEPRTPSSYKERHSWKAICETIRAELSQLDGFA